MDAVYEIARLDAMHVAVQESADIEAQFGQISGSRPVISIMLRMRDQAARALVELAHVDPEDPKAIRTLQNKVRMFSEFLEFMQKIYLEGIEADQELTQQNVDEMADLAGVSVDDGGIAEYLKEKPSDDN